MGNRIPLVQGAAAQFTIDLTGLDGQPYTAAALVGSTAILRLRTDPAGADVLKFQTPDATHLAITSTDSTLTFGFTAQDTAGLTVGTQYYYQVELDLADGTVTQPVEWSFADVSLGGVTAPAQPPFTNTVSINENFRLPGDLAYYAPDGTPIQYAQVRVYRKSDYDAGNLASPVGITTTNAFGGWVNPILVTTGYTYTVRFELPYTWGPDTKEFFA